MADNSKVITVSLTVTSKHKLHYNSAGEPVGFIDGEGRIYRPYLILECETPDPNGDDSTYEDLHEEDFEERGIVPMGFSEAFVMDA
jgi:hypothetical protein